MKPIKIYQFIFLIFVCMLFVSCAATKKPPYKKKQRKMKKKPCDCPTYFKKDTVNYYFLS